MTVQLWIGQSAPGRKMVPPRERCLLSWPGFQASAGATLASLRDRRQFCDVTLACEDNQQVQAHRVVLSSCSPLLEAMLTSLHHPHPLLYLPSTKASTLASLVDFVYRGEVELPTSELPPFLTLAAMLQVRGATELDTQQVESKRGGQQNPERKLEEEGGSEDLDTIFEAELLQELSQELLEEKPSTGPLLSPSPLYSGRQVALAPEEALRLLTCPPAYTDSLRQVASGKGGQVYVLKCDNVPTHADWKLAGHRMKSINGGKTVHPRSNPSESIIRRTYLHDTETPSGMQKVLERGFKRYLWYLKSDPNTILIQYIGDEKLSIIPVVFPQKDQDCLSENSFEHNKDVEPSIAAPTEESSVESNRVFEYNFQNQTKSPTKPLSVSDPISLEWTAFQALPSPSGEPTHEPLCRDRHTPLSAEEVLHLLTSVPTYTDRLDDVANGKGGEVYLFRSDTELSYTDWRLAGHRMKATNGCKTIHAKKNVQTDIVRNRYFLAIAGRAEPEKGFKRLVWHLKSDLKTIVVQYIGDDTLAPPKQNLNPETGFYYQLRR